jgi:hypothetical protein
MHRSHYPFNTTFGMGQQDADENDSWLDRSLTDDRPHRDIFTNQYKVLKRQISNELSLKNKTAVDMVRQIQKLLLNLIYLNLTSGQTRIKKARHYEYHKIIIDFYNSLSSIWL